MSAEVKQFLYAWCGKQKTAPNYELRTTGSKIRQRFMCEVGMLICCVVVMALESGR